MTSRYVLLWHTLLYQTGGEAADCQTESKRERNMFCLLTERLECCITNECLETSEMKWHTISKLHVAEVFLRKGPVHQFNVSGILIGLVVSAVFPLGSVHVHGAAEGDREVPAEDHTWVPVRISSLTNTSDGSEEGFYDHLSLKLLLGNMALVLNGVRAIFKTTVMVWGSRRYSCDWGDLLLKETASWWISGIQYSLNSLTWSVNSLYM